jgi:hypothetical protein
MFKGTAGFIQNAVVMPVELVGDGEEEEEKRVANDAKSWSPPRAPENLRE